MLPIVSAFLAASLVLAVIPGPGVIYIVARTLSQGRSVGLASVAGVALGNLGNVCIAAFGLGAVLGVSSTAFLLVKYAGAFYLVYLGLQALRAPTPEAESGDKAPGEWGAFRDGILVALFNPKTALFFVAFLPQFISPELSPLRQSLALGTLFVFVAAVTDTVYVLLASVTARHLLRAKNPLNLGRYLTAGVYVGLGVFAAFTGSRSSK